MAILSAYNGRGDIRANTFIDGDYAAMVDFTRQPNASGPQPDYQGWPPATARSAGRAPGRRWGGQLSSADTFTSPGVALVSFLRPLSYLSRFSLGVRGAAYGLPAYGQRATISRMRVYIEYRLGIGVCPFCLTIPIRFDLLNESAQSPPNTLPYETLPGGTTNLFAESGDCSLAQLPSSLFLRTSLYNGPICFVPSSSALDVQTITLATAFAKYINTTDNPSFRRAAPFVAASSAEGYNLNHLTFTPRNSEWIFSQMQGAQPPCSPSDQDCASPSAIVGPAGICPGGQAVYSIQNAPPGATVLWSTSPAGAVSPATGSGPTFTVSAPASGVGTFFTLQAQVTACAEPLRRAVPITNGYVDTDLDRQGMLKVCPFTTVIVRVTGANIQPPYYWTVMTYRNGQPRTSPVFTTQAPELDVTVDTEQTEVTVTAQSVCTGLTVAEAPRTITPYIDPNGGFYCDPYSPRPAPARPGATTDGSKARTAALYPNPGPVGVAVAEALWDVHTATL